MASFNRVILMGRLTADPELKTTPNGVSVTTFTVAVDRRFSKDAEKQADFINCVAWRSNAEFISRYFNKGKAILVEGSLQTRNYTAQDGSKRYYTEVVVDNSTFVERKDATGGYTQSEPSYYGNAPAPESAPSQAAPVTPNFEEVAAEDDLPF